MPTVKRSSASPEEFRPFIPPEAAPREFTFRALVVGTILGVLFGASSLYLVLKVGITVSASIPVAVISLTLFRLWSRAGGRDATLLENNIVQTAGSAGESIAFGLGVTMPAIMILGFDLEITRVMLVALLGGLLGILMMIPLRRALIVAEHGKLKYPEGTACAEVLKAGADPESLSLASGNSGPELPAPAPVRDQQATSAAGLNATPIFAGFGIGLIYKSLMSALKLWKDTPEKVFGAPLRGGSVAGEISPELLGVGYIIGPRIASIMMAGGVLNALVLIPMIKFFGLNQVLAPGEKPIVDLTPSEMRSAYVLYIGAGAVAAGGIISLLRSLPLILHGIRSGLSDLKDSVTAKTPGLRTERDLPISFVGLGIVALVIAIYVSPPLHMNLLGAILIVVCGFLFVAVSSRLTGEIGSSSNPISGMTVATLLLTCLAFLVKGWTGPAYFVTALSVGGIVCIAASNAGSTSQDLKTGFLLGSTPKFQQLAILVGAIGSAVLLGPILLELNHTATIYVPAAQAAPNLKLNVTASDLPVERIKSTQAEVDGKTFHVWHKLDTAGGPEGKYLVDENGAAVWFVDPGINGNFETRPDGTKVHKLQAPKARLMSYIIKGILGGNLPWAMVLFGVMIALVLELCGISSLAFAVGVYLPISSSSPVFVGGLIRWLADWRLRRRLRERNLEEHELAAESDRSPGVLLASGYIAGGAIAGIIIAFLAGALPSVDAKLTSWAEGRNPLFNGAHADWLALIPFAALCAVLHFVARTTSQGNVRRENGT